MDDLREDQAQIGEVLIRYATGIDRRDWSLFRTCWTPDAEVDYGELGRFSGVDAITDLMTAVHGNMGPTHHRMSNVVIAIDGVRAEVQSYVHAVLIAVPDEPASWVDAVGNYEDVFSRTAEGWRISRRTAHIARVLTAAGVR